MYRSQLMPKNNGSSVPVQIVVGQARLAEELRRWCYNDFKMHEALGEEVIQPKDAVIHKEGAKKLLAKYLKQRW